MLRGHSQDILINITLFNDTHRAGETDDINDCADYSTISKKAQAHAESAGRLTVEALANDLAQLCLAEPNVQRVIVRALVGVPQSARKCEVEQ